MAGDRKDKHAEGNRDGLWQVESPIRGNSLSVDPHLRRALPDSRPEVGESFKTADMRTPEYVVLHEGEGTFRR